MIKKVVLVLLFCACCFNILYSQTSFIVSNHLDISIEEELLINDTALFHLLQIPFLGFDIDMYSSPGISAFFETTDNNLLLDLEAYNNNVDDIAHHLIDIQNSLLYYAFQHGQSVYSFGLNHRLFLEASLSKELVSLLIDGNYQYLNQYIDFDNKNYVRAYNYFSLFFGYAKNLNDRFLLSAKLKLIKGVAEFGTNNQTLSFLFSDNFDTANNPFSSQISTDIGYFANSDYNPLSNLGFATDLFLDYNYNERLKFYTQVSDLGFIIWKENQYISQGDFKFEGLDYELDQILSTEFNNLQDTLADIFDIIESKGVNKLRLLPFDINLGVKYSFNDQKNQINTSYSIKKLYNTFLHTGQISYVRYFEQYNFSIIPSYSFNKFNYVNFSVMLNKKWQRRFYTNFYLENIFGFINQSTTRSSGCGLELYILF